jgi:hypothetical protein
MKVKFKQIKPWPIFHLSFETCRDLAMAFIRIQEWYESPKFRHKIFTLEEFKEWYTKERGTFSYAQDWAGFNVPSTAIYAVWKHFKNHSPQEKQLFKLLTEQGLLITDKPKYKYCLIGTYGRDKTETVEHEIRHGLFFCKPEYRRQILKVLARFSTPHLRKNLLKMGYHQAVLSDEVQAYVLTSCPPLGRTKQLKRALKKIEKDFMKEREQ